MNGTAQQPELVNYDAQLKISSMVSDFDACVARYRSLSIETCTDVSKRVEYSYGRSALERLDVFRPDLEIAARPVHVFFHGGYWRAFDKIDYSFIARPIVEANAIAVIANYGLMPSVSMTQLIAQCRAVIRWLHANAIRLGANPNRISISGHSAGAHIAAVLSMTRWADYDLPDDIIKSTLTVSGIYDLGPVLQSYLKTETGMTADDVAQFSPIAWVEHGQRPGMPLLIAVGEEESAEFQRQSTTFAQALRKQGGDVDLLRIAQRNHMNIVLELGSSQCELGRKLVERILAT
jgi:arylformamidase